MDAVFCTMSFVERCRSNGAVYGNAFGAWATMHVAQQVPMSRDKDLAEQRPVDRRASCRPLSSSNRFPLMRLMLQGMCRRHEGLCMHGVVSVGGVHAEFGLGEAFAGGEPFAAGTGFRSWLSVARGSLSRCLSCFGGP